MISQAKRIADLTNDFERKNRQKDIPIFSFSSGKGGTGKSFLILNIAVKLAELGNKVLLVDADFNFANLNTMLNINPKKNLSDYFLGKEKFENIIYSVIKNLDLISGISGLESRISEIDINRMFLELQRINNEYDIILIDNSSGASNFTVAVLKNSTYNIIVLNTDPTSVMDSYVILKILKQINYLNDRLIIVNKSLSTEDGEIGFENLKRASLHFLKFPIKLMGVVNFSKDAMQSVKNQKPLFGENHSKSILDEFKIICNEISVYMQVDNNRQI